MLRFLRNIRQKLIEQENVRKYIWYALGEIFLVMIGILLALQVNNWNEERKELHLEQEFMAQLLDDARQDSVFFMNRLNLLTNNYDEWQRMVFQPQISWSDSVQLVAQDSVIYFFSRAIHDSFLINNNPDPFEKVSDSHLKETLREYQNAHNYVSQATELSNRIIEEYGVQIELKYTAELNRIRSGDESIPSDFEFLKSNEIQSTLQMLNLTTMNAINQIPGFLEVNSTLIQQLQERLR